jgi:PAS domain S-box-containing protein
LRSVEQAREQLTTLRVRLEREITAPKAPEIRTALGDLQQTLEKLQARYGLLREILERTTDAVFAKDTTGVYLMINPGGAAMFGRSVESIVGFDDTALFGPEGAQQIMAFDREVMQTGAPRTYEANVNIGGVATTLLTTETAWYEPQGTLRGLIGTSEDITERKRVENIAAAQRDRLRSLASEIVIGEERLRKTLAADLHNGLGQDIALAKMKLAELRRTSTADLHEPLARIETLVEQADRSLRAVSFQISPPSLHDLGLVAALEWLAEDIEARYGIKVRIDDEGATPMVNERIRVMLFRAVRELLHNAATHSGAREVRVRLHTDDDHLRIRVDDGGSGFETSDVGTRKHGLFGIREQLEHVGGSMTIDTSPGRGTTVTLLAPFEIASTPGPEARRRDADPSDARRAHVPAGNIIT